MSATLKILLVAALLAAHPASSTLAQGRFAYRLETTPEEGPVDPTIAGRYSQDWQTCSKAKVATPDLAPCYRAEFVRQDDRLNRTWAETLRRTPPSERPALLEAQRRWVAQRDPFCHANGDGLRGSLVSIAYLDCRIEVTIRRTIWLERL